VKVGTPFIENRLEKDRKERKLSSKTYVQHSIGITDEKID
jgi:hypothetical protein